MVSVLCDAHNALAIFASILDCGAYDSPVNINGHFAGQCTLIPDACAKRRSTRPKRPPSKHASLGGNAPAPENTGQIKRASGELEDAADPQDEANVAAVNNVALAPEAVDASAAGSDTTLACEREILECFGRMVLLKARLMPR